MLYRLKNGCNWEDLPKDLPTYSTVFWHYTEWRKAGSVEKLMTVLHREVRKQVGKKPQGTTLIMADSQAVKNTCNASVESKGFCFYKTTNGIKRHLAVDTLGFPFFTLCTPANVSDDAIAPFKRLGSFLLRQHAPGNSGATARRFAALGNAHQDSGSRISHSLSVRLLE